MTAEIIPFNGVTKRDLDPDTTLENLKGAFDGFVILGYTPDGEGFFASTYADNSKVLWPVERCKKQLLETSHD